MSTQTMGRVGPDPTGPDGGVLIPGNELIRALLAVRDGDFSVRLPGDRLGLEGKIADVFNEIVTANARMAAELKRVGESVGNCLLYTSPSPRD